MALPRRHSLNIKGPVPTGFKLAGLRRISVLSNRCAGKMVAVATGNALISAAAD